MSPDPDRFAGARILESSFPDDTGEQAPAVAAALAAYAADRSRTAEVVGAVQEARLLVPVVALLGDVEHDEQGLAHDKSSDMAAVLMQGRDGRLALLAFTGADQMRAWNPEARPVAVPAHLAAQSAIQEEAAALVVDIAGPVTYALEGEDLMGVAARWQLVDVEGRSAWLAPPEDEPPG